MYGLRWKTCSRAISVSDSGTDFRHRIVICVLSYKASCCSESCNVLFNRLYTPIRKSNFVRYHSRAPETEQHFLKGYGTISLHYIILSSYLLRNQRLPNLRKQQDLRNHTCQGVIWQVLAGLWKRKNNYKECDGILPPLCLKQQGRSLGW